MSNHCSFIYDENDDENDEYIIVNNDESIVSIELEKDIINIYKQLIPKPPKPPKLPKKNSSTNTKIKVKIRFNNLNHYKKHLKNKRKRQRDKTKYYSSFI